MEHLIEDKKDIPNKPHYKTIEKILVFARGTFFRMNAKTAPYYHFSLFKNSKGKIDFQGGFSWGGKYGDAFLLDLQTGKLTEGK